VGFKALLETLGEEKMFLSYRYRTPDLLARIESYTDYATLSAVFDSKCILYLMSGRLYVLCSHWTS
jgi:hypothetical protein